MTFVKFDNKKWGYAGDKGTWAAFDTDRDGNKVLKVKKAANGTISSAYHEELEAFCALYGIDFRALSCGSTVSVPA